MVKEPRVEIYLFDYGPRSEVLLHSHSNMIDVLLHVMCIVFNDKMRKGFLTMLVLFKFVLLSFKFVAF